MTEAEIAWVAGFFDGEGCVIIGRKRPTVRITFTQVDGEPLKWIQSELGMGRFRQVKRYGGEYDGTKTHRLEINRKADVKRFINLVLPHVRLEHRLVKLYEALEVLEKRGDG